MKSTIKIRLRLEAEADRLADAEAAALEQWRRLGEERAAVELALRNLPNVVADPATIQPAREALAA